MQFKLSPVVALLLLLLTGNTLANWGCYVGGNTWSEMGTDAEVNSALDVLCQKLTGDYVYYVEDGKCRNVNGHGIYGAIVVTAGPRGSLGAHVSHDACMDLVKQIKDKCVRGGDLGPLFSHPDNYGGDWFRANMILDPNEKNGC